MNTLRNKVVFIDRDGVINRDPGGWTEHSYVTTLEEFIFLPGSVKALKRLSEARYDIVVISNQAGISKGYYTKEKLGEINQKMIDELKTEGVRLKKTYYCIHQNSDNCDCRKPKTGLFRLAEKELGITASGNFFIGDGKMDVEAGKKMNMRTILLSCGKTDLKDVDEWDVKPDYIFDDLLRAVDFILKV